MGGGIVIHDPYVKRWWELEKQDTYPAPGHSWARFFRNQEKLKDSKIEKNLPATLKGVDAVVLAVRHEAYLALDPAFSPVIWAQPGDRNSKRELV